ncbi:transcriptional regulator, TetR family [Caenispirillum bisanense]|uniref:Transcriptional regulator, TetR family n=1 Tax=Caenispirillum bisanense TaxID=414052 RepID=A0A286G9C1_9PROT|nr:transcriptional regulator, TetR family [Caenispirillum bisanense]
MPGPVSDTPCCDKPAGRGRRPDPRKREAIIEAAAALFVSHGYHITMDAIAAEAGVSKQTIYNLFSTKEDLFGAVIADRGERVFGVLSRPPADAGPEEVLRQVGRQFLALVAGGPAICVQRMMVMAGSDPAVTRRYYENGPRRALTLLATYLRQETEKGRLAVPDPDMAAEAFLGMLNGHMQMRTLMGLQSEWPEEYLRRKAEFAVETFLRAYAVSPA